MDVDRVHALNSLQLNSISLTNAKNNLYIQDTDEVAKHYCTTLRHIKTPQNLLKLVTKEGLSKIG